MVDGALASCYPSVHHDLAHIGMSPIRWFPNIIGWIFGDDIASPAYVMISDELRNLMIPDGQFGEY